MDAHLEFAIAACIIMLCGDVPYMIQVWRRKVRPSIPTWCLWSLICLAVVLNYKSAGAKENVWPAIIETGIVVTIAILAIWRRGEVLRLSLLERLSIVLCIASLTGWWLIGDKPELARWSFALSMLADVSASYPVLHLAWSRPEEDRPYAWVLYCIANIVALGSISEHTVANYTLPAYLITLSAGIFIPLIRYRIKNAIPIREWV